LDDLRHSPAARDTKSSTRVIAIVIRSLNTFIKKKMKKKETETETEMKKNYQETEAEI
jgi:hypothetical protein